MSEKNTITLGAGFEFKIDSDFYANLSKLLAELEAEKNKSNPESTKFAFASNLLETAKSKVKDLIESRMQKIVTEALTQCGRRNKKQISMLLTPEERKLYDEVHAMISGWVGDRNEQVFGSASSKKKEIPREETDKTAGEVSTQAPVQTPVQTPEHAPKANDYKEYMTVRMLRDLPTFVGDDNRNYTLSREDIAMVPAVNGNILVGKKAAVQIKPIS